MINAKYPKFDSSPLSCYSKYTIHSPLHPVCQNHQHNLLGFINIYKLLISTIYWIPM